MSQKIDFRRYGDMYCKIKYDDQEAIIECDFDDDCQDCPVYKESSEYTEKR